MGEIDRFWVATLERLVVVGFDFILDVVDEPVDSICSETTLIPLLEGLTFADLAKMSYCDLALSSARSASDDVNNLPER